MEDNFPETPQKVSRNDASAIMEMLKSFKSEASESARKADERLQRLEDRVFIESFPVTKLSSSKRHEVKGILLEEDSLVNHKFNVVHRRLVDEVGQESTGIGADDSSPSADEDNVCDKQISKVNYDLYAATHKLPINLNKQYSFI